MDYQEAINIIRNLRAEVADSNDWHPFMVSLWAAAPNWIVDASTDDSKIGSIVSGKWQQLSVKNMAVAALDFVLRYLEKRQNHRM